MVTENQIFWTILRDLRGGHNLEFKKRDTFLPYGRQSIDNDDVKIVSRVMRGDFLTTGPTINAFEEKLCDYTGAKYAVAVSNGTAALHCAMFAAGVGRGDEIITTSMTFAATSNAALYLGAKPVFVDIYKDTYNIDVSKIEERISKNTKAIVPVHFTGQPCEIDEIYELASKYNLKVIEDGAHAFGARYKGKKLGIKSDFMTLSFHPVKHITTGEGGAILTNDVKAYEKMKLFRSHGITRDTDMLENDDSPWYYEQHALGYNYRMTDIQAALGISQVDKLDKFLKVRRELSEYYNKLFEDNKYVVKPYQLDYVESSWHLYVLKLEFEKLTCTRREFFEQMRELNLGVNVHYIPVYYHPYYKKLGFSKGLCKNAENLYENMITLPLHQNMKKEDVEYVVSCVDYLIDKYKK